ncbi:putative teichuronic acid biosynthesis glycosyltransferase TuaG [Vibrio chagasii]|nr:putative teichuronic acid biosynthesis glycosyltransferase TuaG [Vibrio chagasii]
MLVSIITPSYNCSSTISETYESIVKQSFTNWEWLVTDDCSVDQSLEILTDIANNDSRVRVFRNLKNSGAAVTRNHSLSKAKGKYVCFIDSDDLWLEDKLTKQIKFMEEHCFDFSFTAYELIDADSAPLGCTVDTHLRHPISYEDMLRKKATLGCSTVMLRRNAFDDISMPLIRTGQDYGLWLKLLKSQVLAMPIPDVLTQYRILPNSISRNKFKKSQRQWQIYREFEKLSLLKSIECFFFYAWRAVFRK